MIAIIVIFAVLLTAWLYWRFFFFFRNPPRRIPSSKDILLSPADGRIVYVKKFSGSQIPVSIKKGKKINLAELLGKSMKKRPGTKVVIGIFMTPFNVHYQRAPLPGKVESIAYTKAKNLPMTLMWVRTCLGLKPYYSGSGHISVNERNTVLFKGKIPVYVVQIADVYVRKILCWVKKGDSVEIGQQYGMIRMGSQVDMIFPVTRKTKILVKEGQKVLAGETIVARI